MAKSEKLEFLQNYRDKNPSIGQKILDDYFLSDDSEIQKDITLFYNTLILPERYK